MIEIRVHLNKEIEGTLWWAEGGDYVGGAGELHRLVEDIQEWAKEEGHEVAIQLAVEEPDPQPIAPRVSLVGVSGFEAPPKNERPERGRYVVRIPA